MPLVGPMSVLVVLTLTADPRAQQVQALQEAVAAFERGVQTKAPARASAHFRRAASKFQLLVD